MVQEASIQWSRRKAGLSPYWCLPWQQTCPPSTALTRYLRTHRDADHAQPFPKTQIHREAVFIIARAAAYGPMCPFKVNGVGAHPGPLFFLSQSLFITAPGHWQQNKGTPEILDTSSKLTTAWCLIATLILTTAYGSFPVKWDFFRIEIIKYCVC